MYVRVALNIPTDKTFTYALSAAQEKEATIGKRVLVPFGKRVLRGYILEKTSRADVEKIKEISEIPDHEPLFTEDELLFYQWVSQYYLYPLGKTLWDLLPTGDVRPKTEKLVALSPGAPLGSEQITGGDGPTRKLTVQQQQLVDFLGERGSVLLSTLRKHFKNASYLVRCLQIKGLLRLEEKEADRRHEPPGAVYAEADPLILNGDQEKALGEISQGLKARVYSPYLLHGVTGSGKTEVYLRAMEQARQAGGGVIFLVPEIGLTPQLLTRLRGRFREEEIAIIHSGISQSIRHDQWRRIQKGHIRVVVGARSALFVPLRELRLIVVDEEHDGSYKQDERLRYNARDLAMVKAKMSGATVVLGSATPAVQTYFNALQEKYRYLSLPKRIEDRALPAVEIVDMRTAREHDNRPPILSPAMNEAIGKTLAEKNQVLLFLNRRGFHTVVLCADCGKVLKCLNCDLPLTYHAALGLLKCHFCDFSLKAYPTCPSCRGNRITSYGVGTEKLEEEIKRLFPQARVGRMDSDTTARRGEAEKILQALAGRELDILVGTQMITKGHDFPNITLVGVVSADLSLNVPDFRAGERTFQILTQVAGRGGRGQTPGKVIIQTFNPDHYAVKRAQTHDYRGFYAEEIKLRQALAYPPYTRLVNLHIASLRKDQGKSGIDKIAKLVKNMSLAGERKKIEILGPAEAPLAKIKGKYRWQILLKGRDLKTQAAVVDTLRTEALKMGLEVKVDVDPMNFM